jgi:hypothetical protein
MVAMMAAGENTFQGTMHYPETAGSKSARKMGVEGGGGGEGGGRRKTREEGTTGEKGGQNSEGGRRDTEQVSGEGNKEGRM